MMHEFQLYETLLRIPLFQGMGKNDIYSVVTHIKLGFMKFETGKIIVKEGEPCTNLLFLTNGTVQVESFADDHSYSVIEDINAPSIIGIENLFGLNQRHTHTFTALTDTNFISVDKDQTMKLGNDYIVFRLNFLNMLSIRIQKVVRQQWRQQPTNLEQRIIRFFENHSIRPAGSKRFIIRMENLALLINDSRLNISKTLNAMQNKGLLQLHRGGIYIPALEKLLM